ncbi:NACHT domain-containing protein [Microbacterium sp. NPDC086615]|uniref:NACHT domain-containing protein n=1 Tax=Microbacterium sp. NPDC086615 TaxID=3154865 RepID=UPI0034121CA3
MVTVGAFVAAGRAVKPAVEGSRVAIRLLRRLGTFDIRWIELGDGPALTASETVDLEAFLAQRESRALLSVLATTLLLTESDEQARALEIVREHFMNAARQYRAAHNSKWLDRREAIWQSIVRMYDEATPAGQHLADAALEIEDFLRTPISRGLSGQARLGSTSRFVVRLSELCGEIERVAAALDTTERIREAIASLPTPPIITYTDATTTATFQDLYVRRTLRDAETDSPIEDQLLTTKGAPFRAVVHGAPGAGKSTFVRNLRRELAADPGNPLPIVLTAREYFPSAQDKSVVQYLCSTLQATLNFELTDAEVIDILTLGAATVIFDGLDEVTDVQQRINFVERICTFANEFPVLSILVTSRSVGYDRAPLPEPAFQTFILDEYSPQQSREYVKRWFHSISRSDLVVDFERESNTIKDLKQNPLLLSLLCILYRERGSIPRRRRQIYQQCADLLFHKWDSHRHIGQPEELHTNGDRIMQELARWVYKSPRAQNGLPESVIVHSIGRYLRDNLGVEDGEARRRAEEFLEFCATRAWLLGSTGTEHGERLFGFTHRTFFEFFAAESFSRTSGDPSQIAEILIEAHKRDTTSVLPELLLQSIDERLERGAPETFKRVCEKTDDVLLILRLIEGAPLPAAARARGFDRIVAVWRTRRIPNAESTALLTLNPDARDHFIREYVREDRAGSTWVFLSIWASNALSNSTSRFAAPWKEAALEMGKTYDHPSEARYRGVIDVWRWRESLAAAPESPKYRYTTEGVSGPLIGTLWLSFEIAPDRKDDADLKKIWTSTVNNVGVTELSLTPAMAAEFVSEVLQRITSHGMPDASRWRGDQLMAYLYTIGIVYERIRRDEDELDSFLKKISPLARKICESRRTVETYPDQATKRSRPLAGVPEWLSEWVNAKRSFILDPYKAVRPSHPPTRPRYTQDDRS